MSTIQYFTRKDGQNEKPDEPCYLVRIKVDEMLYDGDYKLCNCYYCRMESLLCCDESNENKLNKYYSIEDVYKFCRDSIFINTYIIEVYVKLPIKFKMRWNEIDNYGDWADDDNTNIMYIYNIIKITKYE